jgi:hypothetical protein
VTNSDTTRTFGEVLGESVHGRRVIEATKVPKQVSRERRERVLAHKDLASRLTEPPLRLGDPRHWNGWIPPRWLPEDCCDICAGGRPSCSSREHTRRPNESAVRKQLVAIAAEALQREQPS